MAEQDHKLLYKTKSDRGQDRRRDEILGKQEKNRQDLLNFYRNILEDFSAKEEKKRKERISEIGSMLMLSEWMYQPPDDLMSNWMFLVCPAGSRCIVYTSEGRTMAVHKNGYRFRNWRSRLPGGGGGKDNNRGTVMLDCIYSRDVNICYILDVLHWKDLPLVDTEFSFRQFWIKSKLEEIPTLMDSNGGNQIPLIALNAQPCSLDNLECHFNEYPFFGEDVPKVDGVLFYHKSAYYSRGSTPLVLWAKVFMLPELTGTSVCDGFNDEKPRTYTNCVDFMIKFDEEYNKRKKKSPMVRKEQEVMDLAEEKDSLEEPLENMLQDERRDESSEDESMEARLMKLVDVELETCD